MSQAPVRIAVCGAGAMGSGIAEIAAQRGANVKVFDVNADALAGSEARITKSIEKLAAKGKLTSEDAAAIRGRMQWVSSLDELADCELVIEAIIEDAAIKGRLFEGLEAVVSPEAVIATNTSSLPIGRLARALSRPERFVGMHFFNPATAMKLVEVISGPATAPAAAQLVIAAAETWGKVAVPVADVPGFIVNRVARPYYAEAFTALSEKAAEAHEIDALFRAVGFRMGPLELTDLIGQDVNFSVARSVYESYFGQTRFVPQLMQSALVDAGWLGRKSGRGIYDHSEGAPPLPEIAATRAQANGAHRTAAGQLAPGELLAVDDAMVGMTAGATARSAAKRVGSEVALIDWFTPDGQGPIGYSASGPQASAAAEGVIAALGRPAVQIADRPGLIVCRTLAQIANAAADAVFEHVSDEQGIDSALRFGANYPFGPFAWADRVGRATVARTLRTIAEETGQAMYLPSQYLRD
ncbi:3-hydroxyacyl-CoA dehydrogenase NAD-binding domain-containing protein [Novosphingobium sp. 9U]|uniref:3-hydroxyacyl-CoA dehydrogenase NAD-binding domain-containing protein n=1 Tax=Novosphingobium sp. 9U TaxID=2653158 RepID=UPI0012EF1BE4|nr:3-hydroxyacyl-CoA dehydrogenase NAD-binding domain-containing protein [Novosphingobium sp. 9U]VWX54161.1 3-hydroxybutyryl-CoA dehydrogenase [Novosphingobium sp. 9U]